jgi:hypothetical protein
MHYNYNVHQTKEINGRETILVLKICIIIICYCYFLLKCLFFFVAGIDHLPSHPNAGIDHLPSHPNALT